MRNKIRPSEEKSNWISNIFSNKNYEEMEDFMASMAEIYLQGSMEKEQDEFIGRSYYEHQGDTVQERETEKTNIYRNGYYPRSVRTIGSKMIVISRCWTML